MGSEWRRGQGCQRGEREFAVLSTKRLSTPSPRGVSEGWEGTNRMERRSTGLMESREWRFHEDLGSDGRDRSAVLICGRNDCGGQTKCIECHRRMKEAEEVLPSFLGAKVQCDSMCMLCAAESLLTSSSDYITN